MSKLFSHYCDCFGVTVFLFLGSKDEMLKELPKAPVHFDKDSLANLVSNIRDQDAGLTLELRGADSIAQYMIMLPSFTFDINDYVTLQHECSHACHLALLERHIKDFGQEDTYHCLIYFIDSVYRSFITKLNKWREDEEKKKEKDEENMNNSIESIVSNEEESTADVELKKEIEKKEKMKKNKKK